jgi:DNA modification methylase
MAAMLENTLYTKKYGAAYVGDSLELLDCISSDLIDLVITSPPFALLSEKGYGNVEQGAYIDWLFAFCKKVYRVLAPQGSFVIDLGGAYQTKRSVRSLYNYRILFKLCDELDFRLKEEFFATTIPRYLRQNQSYLAASTFRFVNKSESIAAASTLFKKLLARQEKINITRSAQIHIET